MEITFEGVLVGAILALIGALVTYRIATIEEPAEDPRARCLECGAPDGHPCDPECGVYDPEPRDE